MLSTRPNFFCLIHKRKLLLDFDIFLNTTCSGLGVYISGLGVYIKPEFERSQNFRQNYWKETCNMKRNLA